MQGIDVAKWQGTIEWPKVKNAGIQFAILKITNKQNNIEGAFLRNYEGAKGESIPIGVYRYVYARTVEQAELEARKILEALNGKTLQLGIWLDLEDSTIRVGKSLLNKIIEKETSLLNAAGYKVGIYCNKDWYYNVLDSHYLCKSHPFWIARYPKNDVGVIVDALSPREYACAWQYSSKGKVPGITGDVDMDVAFVDIADLMKYKGQQYNTTYYPRYTGTSGMIDAVLDAIGAHKDFRDFQDWRKRITIAEANGIYGYTGKASENLKIVEMAKKGNLLKP